MKEFIDLISNNAVMANLESAILITIIAGVILFLIPEKASLTKGIMALAVAVTAGVLTVGIYTSGPQRFIPELWNIGRYLTLRIDNLSRLVLMFISLFSVLILLYSIVYMKGKRIRNYYS